MLLLRLLERGWIPNKRSRKSPSSAWLPVFFPLKPRTVSVSKVPERTSPLQLRPHGSPRREMREGTPDMEQFGHVFCLNGQSLLHILKNGKPKLLSSASQPASQILAGKQPASQPGTHAASLRLGPRPTAPSSQPCSPADADPERNRCDPSVAMR